MTYGLPLFEGQKPAGITLTITGTITDEILQPAQPLNLGDTVIVVCVAEVIGVNHKTKDGKVTRLRTLAVSEVMMPDSDDGEELLGDARAANVDFEERARLRETGQDRMIVVDRDTGEVINELVAP